MLHPCATSAFIAAVQPPAMHGSSSSSARAAFLAWFSVYSAAVAFPPSAAQRLAAAYADAA
jgi:hypothetical protein